jgi:hypothetical protein
LNRYHEAGKTKIRDVEMWGEGLEPKTCQKILGYDANALYLWAILQDMPTGSYTRRRAETNFKPEHSRRMADEWIAWEADQRGIKYEISWITPRNVLAQENSPWKAFIVKVKLSSNFMVS